jgi:hypothetical protein
MTYKNEDKLPQEQVDEMLLKLRKHFQEPVLPLGKFCSAMDTWAQCIVEGVSRASNKTTAQGNEYHMWLTQMFIDIRKSGLLGRLFYDNEKKRTIPCPRHKGCMDTGLWAGAGDWPDDCLCDGSGWVPETDTWPDHIRSWAQRNSYDMVVLEAKLEKIKELLKDVK